MLAPNPKPRSVQSSRWDGAIFLMTPGTSCLPTIVLSFWDGQKAQRPAPKGLEDSAQGFNPGNQPIKRFALKGREERANETYYKDTLCYNDTLCSRG
jgi:hypothetical protein